MKRERIETLLKQLKSGVYEKDTEIGMSLLAALAGESVLLLGPPGVAKSMVARRVKSAFSGARSFEYLMSRFSTPDEIFGPVSISKLKSDDLYERNLDGFMPSADIVFLDEIWKAGPAILNTLLTIINEKTFRNGRDELHVPLKLLMGASNELPANGEGLEALWDRFLVRIVSRCVTNEQNFYHILCDDMPGDDVAVDEPITATEYADWQREMQSIGVEKDVLSTISFIRKHLGSLRLHDDDEETNRVHNIYVSDRRWQHILRLLRASALVHDRQTVEKADLLSLVHCLWNEPEEIDAVRSLVVHALFEDCNKELQRISAALSIEVKRSRARLAMSQAGRENYHLDDNKQLFDGFYYRIDRYDTGNTYIFFVDYKNMKRFSPVNAPMDGIIYPDAHNPGNTVIRTMADCMGMVSNKVGAQKVKLYRDDDNIYINGVKCPIHQLPVGTSQPPLEQLLPPFPDADYDEMIETLATRVSDLTDSLTRANLFVGDDERREVERQQNELNHKIALLRVEAQKVYYVGD